MLFVDQKVTKKVSPKSYAVPRQKGDFESKSVVVKAGSTVRLVIDQPVSETSEP